MKNALVLYWSKTGNTRKVAISIADGLESAGLDVSLKTTTKAEKVDYLNTT